MKFRILAFSTLFLFISSVSFAQTEDQELESNTALSSNTDVFNYNMQLVNLLKGKRPCDINKLSKVFDRGAQVNTQDKTGATPLHYAAKRADANTLDLVKYLVEEKYASDTIIDKDKRIALHCAAGNRAGYDVVGFLIKNGSNVNAVSYKGTPLHFAAGNPAGKDIAELLIDNGAYLDAMNTNNMTPLHVAAQNIEGGLLIVNVLVDAGASMDIQANLGLPIHYASLYQKKAEVVNYFLEDGNLVNEKGDGGRTPLHFACMNQEGKDIVLTLVESGADINAVDEFGKTPLHYAAENPTGTDIVDILVNIDGIEANEKDMNGNTPIQLAQGAENSDSADAIKAALSSKGGSKKKKD